MRILYTVIFTVFIILTTNSQIKDSIKLIDHAQVHKSIDTIRLVNKIDLNDFDIQKIEKSWDTIKIPEFVFINRKLLDSLLKPYYMVSTDIITKDTTFTHRYRMVIDTNTLDTTYVQKPKEKNILRYLVLMV